MAESHATKLNFLCATADTPQLTAEAVHLHFSAWGTITDAFIASDAGQDANRHGYVEYEAATSCDSALGAAHHSIAGVDLKVERAEALPAGEEQGVRIYVVCSKFVDSTGLRVAFEVFGEVMELKLLRDVHGKSRGCAFVTFADRACAEAAVRQCNGQQLAGRVMKVMMAERRRASSGGSEASISGGDAAGGGVAGDGAVWTPGATVPPCAVIAPAKATASPACANEPPKRPCLAAADATVGPFSAAASPPRHVMTPATMPQPSAMTPNPTPSPTGTPPGANAPQPPVNQPLLPPPPRSPPKPAQKPLPPPQATQAEALLEPQVAAAVATSGSPCTAGRRPTAATLSPCALGAAGVAGIAGMGTDSPDQPVSQRAAAVGTDGGGTDVLVRGGCTATEVVSATGSCPVESASLGGGCSSGNLSAVTLAFAHEFAVGASTCAPGPAACMRPDRPRACGWEGACVCTCRCVGGECESADECGCGAVGLPGIASSLRALRLPPAPLPLR